MNMLKLCYGIVLDGLPEIPEFHFFSGVWTPPVPIYIVHNVVFLECLERHMSSSQACRGSPPGPTEN